MCKGPEVQLDLRRLEAQSSMPAHSLCVLTELNFILQAQGALDNLRGPTRSDGKFPLVAARVPSFTVMSKTGNTDKANVTHFP